MYKAILHFLSGLSHQLRLKFVKPTTSFNSPINGHPEINCILIHAFSHGSELAFRRIYDHYAPAIYRVSKRNLGSGQLAEELLVKVFSAFWLEREKFSEAEQVRLYLFSKAKSVAIRLIEKALQQMLAERLNREG